MKKFLLILTIFFMGTTLYAEEQEVVKKVVYDLTTGQMDRIDKQLIGGIVRSHEYYQSKLEELKVRIVVHGNAYKFFMADLNNTVYAYDEKLLEVQKDLGKRLKNLVENYNVEIVVCHTGVKYRKLNEKAFYPFAKMVESAGIGLIDAQYEGYVYLPVQD